MNETDRLMEIFLSWQFGVAAVAIAAIVDRVKKITRHLLPKHKQSELLKSLFACLNIILGILIATIPSFLPGEHFSHRMLVGICAGFLSNFAYSIVLKRFGKDKNDSIMTSSPQLSLQSGSTGTPGPISGTLKKPR